MVTHQRVKSGTGRKCGAPANEMHTSFAKRVTCPACKPQAAPRGPQHTCHLPGTTVLCVACKGAK